jgi:V/A-type H+-transporting ATPase subunit F
MYKVCVIGDIYSVLGLKALGYDVFPVASAEEADEVIKRTYKEYAVIFITDGYARELKGTVEAFRDKKIPAVIPIPDASGRSAYGMEHIRDAMERAVGADILYKEG